MQHAAASRLVGTLATLLFGLGQAACEGGGNAPGGDGGAATQTDGGGPGPSSSDGGAGPAADGGPRPDGATRGDAARRRDGGASVADQRRAADTGGGPSKAQVQLTYSGCHPSFAGNVYVIHSGGVLTVSAVQGSLTGSLQLDLKGQVGSIALSSKHRQQTGVIVNLIDGTTYTNLTTDTLYYQGKKPDPIGGTLFVKQWQPASGLAEIGFIGVTLENVSTHALCTVNGTLKTTGLTF